MGPDFQVNHANTNAACIAIILAFIMAPAVVLLLLNFGVNKESGDGGFEIAMKAFDEPICLFLTACN